MASIICVTLMALVYVHQHVEMVKLSYSIERKEKKVKELLDRRASLGYNINNLESPSRLEKVLIAQKIDIAFPKRNHVINSARLNDQLRTNAHLKNMGLERRPNILNGIIDFFSPRAEAQTRGK